MVKKRRYNNTPLQVEARKRNWSLFRLKGLVAALNVIEKDITSLGITGGALNFSEARIEIREIISKVKNS